MRTYEPNVNLSVLTRDVLILMTINIVLFPDDATSALSSEASPSSSSAPSPTDAMIAPGERRPLPIGSGRSQKKMASSFGVAEPATGVWSSAFNSKFPWHLHASCLRVNP